MHRNYELDNFLEFDYTSLKIKGSCSIHPIYTDKELREFFKYLKSETSELVRYALYCLLIKHSNDQQLKSTLRVQLSKETCTYLKLITLDYWKKDTNRINTMDELVKQMGL